MKVYSLPVLFLAVAAALVYWSEPVEATANCQPASPAANTCMGFSMVGTTTGGTASGRCFALRMVDAGPTCSTGGIGTTANEATWQMDAGGCLTFYYRDTPNGLVPPAVPNKVTIQVYNDQGNNLIKTFLSAAAEPAQDGVANAFSFCATSDGNVGSAARAGTYFLYLNAVKDNGNGLPGNTNYNIGTNGAGSQDTSFDAGFLRARIAVSSLTRSAYPAGSTFAYGPAGDESITITATFTDPNGDANHEGGMTSILDSATLLVGQAGANVDMDGSSLAQNFVVDSTFPAANSPYVAGFTLTQNALNGLTWTILQSAGHGSGLTRVSDTFIRTDATFNIDAGIVFDSTGTGTYAAPDGQWVNKLTNSAGAVVTKYNRGETAYFEGYLLNARSEKLTRSMNLAVEDTAPTTCNGPASFTPSGAGLYSGTYTVPTGGACIAAATDAGTPRYWRATNTDQNKRSDEDHTVSSLYYVDAHPQLADPLVVDNFPTEDAGEDLAYFVRSDGMGGDDSDTVHGYCHVVSVRKDLNVDTSGNAVTGEYLDPTAAVRSTGVADTDSTGWTIHRDLLATTPLGTWEWECSVSFNGNTGTDTEPFTIGVEGGGGATEYVGTDPLKVFSSPIIANPGEPIVSVISASFLNGSARLGAADQIFIKVYDTDQTLVVNDVNPTEIGFGSYYYSFTPAANAVLGGWTVLVNTTDGANVVGTSNTFFLESDGHVDPVTNFETATTTSGLEFLALIAVVIVAILIWSRSTDYVVQIGMGVLCFVPAIIWMRLAILSDGPVVATFNAILAVFAGVVGGYLIIRTGIDQFQKKKAGA